MRILVPFLLLCLAACESTDHRCLNIAVQQIESATSASADARARRTGTTTNIVTPPPRPSELAWSAEHCFNGHAR